MYNDTSNHMYVIKYIYIHKCINLVTYTHMYNHIYV